MSRKKYTFAQLEALIKKARQAKKKKEVQRWRKLYREKLTNWNKAWKLAQERLVAKQKAKRARREALERVQRAKEESRLHRKKRLGEIYNYFRQELNKLDRSKHPEYFTAHLDLDPITSRELKKKSRQYPEYDFYAEFRKNKKNLLYRLNKGGRDYLLKQTTRAYQEEQAEQKNQIRYWQERAGLIKARGDTLIKKGQKIKLFFPEKGEHKDFFQKKKEFKEFWKGILTFESSTQDQTRIGELSKELYQKSPWRIRDRFLIKTNQPSVSHGMGDIFNKYWKNNTDYPFSYSRKHYLRAIGEMLRKTKPEGELVPDSEIDFDRYGKPKFKEGQVIVLDSKKPGRSWSVYKNVTNLEKRFEKEIHFKAHENYMNEYGTELEKDIFFNRRKKGFLCVIEAMGFDCRANQGTSEPWCFFCIQWGNPCHPPVLPIHCPWRYTFKTGMCGMVEHREANKQWHWSLQGEKTNVAGKDWGSCHVGRYDHKKRSKR